MTKLEDIPALIYIMLYTQGKDGRLRKATENKKLDILFDFPDFRPAALLKIHNGSYEVLSIDNTEGVSADAIIKGKFEDLVEVSTGISAGVKQILTGKVKIKGAIKALQLLKILGEKEAK
jgi:putative sterol carrier protein